MNVLSYVPAQYVAYVSFAGMVAAAVVALFPAPTAKPWSYVWAALNWLALNVGHAKNAEATPPSPVETKPLPAVGIVSK